MIAIQLRHNIGEVKARVKQLRDEITDKAAAAALNKTADKARTAMTRAITGEFNIKAAEVRSSLSVSRASLKLGRLDAVLSAFGSRKRNGRALNLIHFLERSVTMAQARRRRKDGTLGQLGFRIKKGGPIKFLKGAFIGNKGRTVFIREGRSRLPIKALQTIDVPQMFNTKRINKAVVETIEREFPIEFERAARLFTDRFNSAR